MSNEMLQPTYGYLHRIEAVHDLIRDQFYWFSRLIKILDLACFSFFFFSVKICMQVQTSHADFGKKTMFLKKKPNKRKKKKKKKKYKDKYYIY